MGAAAYSKHCCHAGARVTRPTVKPGYPSFRGGCSTYAPLIAYAWLACSLSAAAAEQHDEGRNEEPEVDDPLALERRRQQCVDGTHEEDHAHAKHGIGGDHGPDASLPGRAETRLRVRPFSHTVAVETAGMTPR